MINQSITAFFPCYNDSGTIGSLVILTDSVLQKITEDYEIIVIDDCSKDDSLDVLESLVADYPRLKIVKHGQNQGYGGALQSGFRSASKDWIFYTDGDAQYNVKELSLLVKAMQKGDVDIVNGYKIQRHDPFYRIVIGKIYHHTVKLAFGLKIRDVDCDFRLIKRSVFDKVKLTQNSGVICVELVKKIQSAGFRFAEVPVNHYFRTHGKSQFFNYKRILKVLWGLGRLWNKLVLCPALEQYKQYRQQKKVASHG